MTKVIKHINDFATDEALAEAYESGVTVDLGNLGEATQDQLIEYYNRIQRAYHITALKNKVVLEDNKDLTVSIIKLK